MLSILLAILIFSILLGIPALASEEHDDQKRVAFVHNAIQDGANFVVIGRELIESKRPVDLLRKYGEQHKNKNLWTK